MSREDDIEAGFTPIEVETIRRATSTSSTNNTTCIQAFKDYFTYKVNDN